MRRFNIKSGAKWESDYGYCRLVKVGRQIYVTGTSARLSTGELVGAGDALAQARQSFKNVKQTLARVDASMDDIVRVRLYVVDIQDNRRAVGEAYKELMSEANAAASILGVAGLVHPDMVVLVEVDAILGSGNTVVERPRIVDATAGDADLTAMLESVNLPLPDPEDPVQMLKSYVAGQLVGCVGYERYGDSALLHSLVVIREAKGEGVGRTLVQSVLDRLTASDVSEVFLLAADTSRYFSYLGFEVVPRDAISPAVQQSHEFQSYEQDDVTCMRLSLRPKA